MKWLVVFILIYAQTAAADFSERLPLRGVWKGSVEADTTDFMPVIFEIRNTDILEHNANIYFFSPVRCVSSYRFIGKFGVQYVLERMRGDSDTLRYDMPRCGKYWGSERLELYFEHKAVRVITSMPATFPGCGATDCFMGVTDGTGYGIDLTLKRVE